MAEKENQNSPLSPEEIDFELEIEEAAKEEAKSPEQIEGNLPILENIIFQEHKYQNPKTHKDMVEYKSPGAPETRKMVVLAQNQKAPETGRPYKVKVIEDTEPDNPRKGKLIVELHYDSLDDKVKDISDQISQKQQKLLAKDIAEQTKEEWAEIAKLYKEIEGVYGTEESIKDATSFEELFKMLRKRGEIKGSKKVYEPESLIKTIEDFRAGKVDHKDITRSEGVREKVLELMKEKPSKQQEVVESPLLEQYEKQVAMLQRLSIIKELTSGKLGIEGIDSQDSQKKKEYPIPELHEIITMIESKRELIEKKEKQGFTRLLLVPFGMKLEDLMEAYKKSILEHHKQGKLFTAKKDINDPNEQLVPLTLDENEPLYVWDGYTDADVSGKLIYWPKSFSESHGGSTKKEILKIREMTKSVAPINQQDFMVGWDVIFVEENPNIPRKNDAKTVGGRTQLDTGGWAIQRYMQGGETIPSPEEYLKGLDKESQDPTSPYRGESGMTPEDQLIYAITYLEEHNQIIDDYKGNGSLSYQIGGYFPASGFVPCACWSRDPSRASMGRSYPRSRYGYCGVRPSVRI